MKEMDADDELRLAIEIAVDAIKSMGAYAWVDSICNYSGMQDAIVEYYRDEIDDRWIAENPTPEDIAERRWEERTDR